MFFFKKTLFSFNEEEGKKFSKVKCSNWRNHGRTLPKNFHILFRAAEIFDHYQQVFAVWYINRPLDVSLSYSVLTVAKKYRFTVSLPEYIHILYKQHFCQTHSSIPCFLAAFWFIETIFQRDANRASQPPYLRTQNPAIPETRSALCQLGNHPVSNGFPAHSQAANGSYSQYGLMMRVGSSSLSADTQTPLHSLICRSCFHLHYGVSLSFCSSVCNILAFGPHVVHTKTQCHALDKCIIIICVED